MFFKLVIQALKQNWFWLKWLVALSLLGYLFYSSRVQLQEFWVRRPNWSDLAIALLIVGASILLTFYRWYLLVWAQEFPFTVRDAMRLGIVGYACNFVRPGSAGGDIVKAGMIAAEQKSRKLVAASTVLLDRILGVFWRSSWSGRLATFFQPAALLKNPVAKIYLAVLWTGAIGGIVGLAVLLHPAVPRSRLMQWMVRLPKIGPAIGGLVNARVALSSPAPSAGICGVDQHRGAFWNAVGLLFLREGRSSGTRDARLLGPPAARPRGRSRSGFHSRSGRAWGHSKD